MKKYLIDKQKTDRIETDNDRQLKVRRNGVVYNSLKLANTLPVSQYGTNYSQHTYRFTVQ